MKTWFLSALLVSSTLSVATSNAEALPLPLPQREERECKRRTVLDYFRLLPSRYFEVNDRRVLLDKSYGPIIDLKNDYMKTGGDGAQGALQLAVFRFKGTETLAVSGGYELGSSFALYRLRNGKLRDVTRQLLTFPPNDKQHAVLPRIGTTIRVQSDDADNDDTGRLLYTILWRNGRFVRR